MPEHPEALAELTAAVERYVAATEPTGEGSVVIGAVLVVEVLDADDSTFLGCVTPSANRSSAIRVGLLHAGLEIALGETLGDDSGD